MVTKHDVVDAFAKTMKGEMSSRTFAQMLMEFYASPEWRRMEAAQAAENLRDWREGRRHLLDLIERERAQGTVIDYEIIPLKEGHDSLCVLVDGQRTVCFPSYFPKECVDMNWESVQRSKKTQRPCGHSKCGTSTSIDDVTLTFGRGELDEHGFWEIPCRLCAEAYEKEFPGRLVWPRKEA